MSAMDVRVSKGTLMKPRLIPWLLASGLALSCSSALAVDPVFGANPITCVDPAPAAVPTPCAAAAAPRPDGYEFINFSFNILVPPPPPPPFPAIIGMDSMRDFINPVNQNLFVHIFGNTVVDVLGAPVQFLVSGTLDGAVVASFGVAVAGLGNALSWDSFGMAPAVSAGVHTLDMHIYIIQLVPFQQSQVNVASLYRATISPVPEVGSWALMLAGLGLVLTRGLRHRAST